MTGPDDSTKYSENQNDPKLFGQSNEAIVKISNIEAPSLTDTGSCISNISENFYKNNLSHLPLKPVADILHIE